MKKDVRAVYAKTAGIYDRRNSNPYTMKMRKMELRFLKRFAKGRILDVGCGTGFHLPYLGDVVGLEPIEEMRKIAEKHRKRVVDGDVENLSFRDNEFDTVVCMYSVLNIVRWERAIKEMCRIAKSGVVLSVSSVYDKGYTLEEKKSLNMDRYVQTKSVHVHGMKMTMHLFTKEEITREFEKNGFDLIAFDSLYRGATPKWGNFQGFSMKDRWEMFLDRFRDKRMGCLYIMAFQKRKP